MDKQHNDPEHAYAIGRLDEEISRLESERECAIETICSLTECDSMVATEKRLAAYVYALDILKKLRVDLGKYCVNVRAIQRLNRNS